jgi:hypothetical protein
MESNNKDAVALFTKVFMNLTARWSEVGSFRQVVKLGLPHAHAALASQNVRYAKRLLEGREYDAMFLDKPGFLQNVGGTSGMGAVIDAVSLLRNNCRSIPRRTGLRYRERAGARSFGLSRNVEMEMRHLSLFLATVLMVNVAAPAIVKGQAVSVGAGSQSCGSWLEARRDAQARESPLLIGLIGAWLQGYLVGTAISEVGEAIGQLVKNGELEADVALSYVKNKDSKSQALVRAALRTNSGWAFDPPAPASLYAWLDKDCREHPLEFVGMSAARLANELSPLKKN